ncbi:hypothetical protein [Planctomyces sp. SH-PL62]|uniref:hypothetical protein n=1 Tax=Planctomyces sp. SH-PL62 TaxID=1636152 RepID=UPI00078DB7D5|nr:hypothetical protein [Planctomyces sp. SH-PL62]AMV38254.1 hypothetical protein VT85_12505 [Planctomyces sp. SH-PL62]
MKASGKRSISIARMMLLVAAVAVVAASPRFLSAAYKFLSDSTVYAPGYTETGFESIRLGMRRAEVLSRLGPPLKTRPKAGSVVLSYSETHVDGFRVLGLDPAYQTYHHDRG